MAWDNRAMSASNVDQAELAKFSALAHRWWDLEGEFAPLHQINPLRLDWIDRIHPLSGTRVVDVGCGGGILADAMARRGADVLGIDLAEKSLKVAQLHALEAQTPRVAYRTVAAEDLATQEPGTFDVVTCMEMLEHVPDPASVVRACAALAKPGGTVFFSTINRNPRSFALAIVGAEYVLGLVPREEAIPDEVLELAKRRQEARAGKNYAEADALRDRIAALGYEVKDTPEDPKINKR